MLGFWTSPKIKAWSNRLSAFELGEGWQNFEVSASVFHSEHVCLLSRFSRVQLFVTPWTVAHQAPRPMGFSRQEDYSGLPCPPPGDLPHPGIEPESPKCPALAGRFFTTSATWEAQNNKWRTDSSLPLSLLHTPFSPSWSSAFSRNISLMSFFCWKTFLPSHCIFNIIPAVPLGLCWRSGPGPRVSCHFLSDTLPTWLRLSHRPWTQVLAPELSNYVL